MFLLRLRLCSPGRFFIWARTCSPPMLRTSGNSSGVRLRVELAVRTRGCLGSEHRILLCLSVCFTIRKSQKLRNRKSLALPSTFSRIARSGSMRAISTAPVIVEKIAKKARSLSATRRPGMKGTIRFL